MYSVKKKLLDVVVFEDSAGNPCCAKDFNTGEVCIFYMLAKLGTVETCFFAPPVGSVYTPLERRGDGLGTLIPIKICPLWRREKI